MTSSSQVYFLPSSIRHLQGFTTEPHVVSFLPVSAPQVTPDSQYDYGSYNCTANNAMGTGSKEFLLIQAGLLTEKFKLFSFSKLTKNKKQHKQTKNIEIILIQI